MNVCVFLCVSSSKTVGLDVQLLSVICALCRRSGVGFGAGSIRHWRNVNLVSFDHSTLLVSRSLSLSLSLSLSFVTTYVGKSDGASRLYGED